MEATTPQKVRRRTLPHARSEGRRRATALLIELGNQLRAARKRRQLTQAALAARAGMTQSRLSQIESGEGGGAPLEAWLALAQALDLPLRVEIGRDRLAAPDDAGHLGLQQLVLRLARPLGFVRTFELPTRPANPSLSVDVGMRDDLRRLLVLVECWNTFGNIGAAVRSTRRKRAEAEALAVAIGGEAGPYRVAVCWVVRASTRNRELMARYPEVFTATFDGSSRAWQRALTERGTDLPADLGLVWADNSLRQLTAWRRPG
ncbi:MAG TPA: helix-turn-helix transcriptional regulator [Candidatus Limnocylindria bacterium]|nr:helix-turn-helix transcriptional regulator [Candidatus Limnocylindria bacterium]